MNMPSKLSAKTKEAFIQYSKKMCTSVALFWMVYRVFNFIVVLLRPELASALVDLSAGVDTIMIVNMSAYTFNSSTEKVSIAFAQRKSLYSSSSDKQEEEDDEESEDSNG